MTEEQVKFLFKQVIEHSNRILSQYDKELMKQAIDKSRTPDELLVTLLNILGKI